MKNYIGTKNVQAERMNELQAAELGYARPNQDDHEWREGYHVVYPDGYHSWSPKNVFEESYSPCETFLERLEIELRELTQRYTKLCEFVNTKRFEELPILEKDLLSRQKVFMEEYIKILQIRIDAAIGCQAG